MNLARLSLNLCGNQKDVSDGIERRISCAALREISASSAPSAVEHS
jgi:hypothetical protein